MTELSDQSSTPKEKEASASPDDKKRKMFIGLDLGTLQSCILSKLNKPGTGEHHGIWVPTVVGYRKMVSGIILPGNSKMLHGDEALEILSIFAW